MRPGSVVIAVGCIACSADPAAPTAPDASTAFTFTAAYMLDASVASAQWGSASYTSGDTIHIDLSFATYADSQTAGLAVQVMSSTGTGSFAIPPPCPPQCVVDDVTSESLDSIVSVTCSAAVITDEGGSCGNTGGQVCGWAS